MGVKTNVSIKLTPMNSFFTSTSPSFGWGRGRSVLYSRTSVPPVLEIVMPDIVFGSEDILRVMCLGVGGLNWADRILMRLLLERMRDVTFRRDMNHR